MNTMKVGKEERECQYQEYGGNFILCAGTYQAKPNAKLVFGLAWYVPVPSPN